MKYLALTLLLGLTIASCTKETLDLTNSQFYNVAQILESSNCNANCEDMADCEGQLVKVVGLLDPSNINGLTHTFVLLDQRDEKTDMIMLVDTMISPSVFDKLIGQGDKVVRATGVLRGTDGTGSSNCKRIINMQISEVDNVVVEQ